MEDLRRRQTFEPSLNMDSKSGPSTKPASSRPSGRTQVVNAASSTSQEAFRNERQSIPTSKPTRTRPNSTSNSHPLSQPKDIPPFKDSSAGATSASLKRSKRMAKLDERTKESDLSDDNEDELGSAQWTEESADEGNGHSKKLRNKVDMSRPIENEEDSDSDEMSLKASSPPPEVPVARKPPNGQSKANTSVSSTDQDLEAENEEKSRLAEVRIHQQRNTLPSFKKKCDPINTRQSLASTSNVPSPSLSSSTAHTRTSMKSKKPIDSSSEDENRSPVKSTKRSFSESISSSSSKHDFKPVSAYAPGPAKASSRLKSNGHHNSPSGSVLHTLTLSTDSATPKAAATRADPKVKTCAVGTKSVVPFPMTFSNQSSSSTPAVTTTTTATTTNPQSFNPDLAKAFEGDSDLSDLTDLEDEDNSSTCTASDSHDGDEATPKRIMPGTKKTSPVRKVQQIINPKDKQIDRKPVSLKGKTAPIGLMAKISKLTGARSSSSTSLGGAESSGKTIKKSSSADTERSTEDGNDAEHDGEGSLTVQERIFLQTKAMERDEAAQRRIKVQARGRPQKIRPKSLCPYCSERLPSAPSAKLVGVLSFLHSISRPSPTSTNPGARKLPMAQSINACALHRSESLLIPLAKKKRWPMQINWEDYIARIKSEPIVRRLKTIVEEKEDSLFYDFAKERVKDLGKGQSRSARGQFEVFEKCQPGYFGEIGQILFHQTLNELFVDPPTYPTDSHLPREPIVTSVTASPLTASDFLYFVLIPELTIILIQQDLGLDRFKDAFDVMTESREYGNSRFAAEEGETVGGVLMTGFLEGDLVEENGIQAVRGKVLGRSELGLDGGSNGGLTRRTSNRRGNGASAVNYEESDTDTDGDRGGRVMAPVKKKKRGERRPREESEDEDEGKRARGVRVAPRPRVSYSGAKDKLKQEGSMEIVVVGESFQTATAAAATTTTEQKRPDDSLDELEDYEFEEAVPDAEPTQRVANTVTADRQTFN